MINLCACIFFFVTLPLFSIKLLFSWIKNCIQSASLHWTGLIGVTVQFAFKLDSFKLASKKCFMWLNSVGHTASALQYTDRNIEALSVHSLQSSEWKSGLMLHTEPSSGLRTPGDSSKFTLYRPDGPWLVHTGLHEQFCYNHESSQVLGLILAHSICSISGDISLRHTGETSSVSF